VSPPGSTLLAALAQRLGRVGLHIVRPAPVAALGSDPLADELARRLPGVRTAIVIGDGGGDFFAGFCQQHDPACDSSDPLDAFTERTIRAVVAMVVPADESILGFPFSDPRPLPMQVLGEAAGLPPPSPLGIQIHPRFGPWWAYRAILLLREEIAALPPIRTACVGCPAPCIAACPVAAPGRAGFRISACADHRMANPACELDCGARRACVVAPEQRYTDHQLAFHMRASLVMIRAHRAAR
jgi:hypothetical protein